jgi:hypothetical protein
MTDQPTPPTQPPYAGYPPAPPAYPPVYSPAGPGGYPPPYPYQASGPQPSKTLAIWAFVLSLAGLCGITAIIAIILAIIALARVNSGHAAGKGLAIAALVISTLCIIGLVGLGGLGVWFSSTLVDRGPDGHIARSGRVFLGDLRVGDCVKDLAETGFLDTVTGVPCSDAHHAEAFATFELPAGEFPGQDAVDAWADRRCAQELNALTIVQGSGLGLTFVRPTGKTSWNIDRIVVCIASTRQATTGMLKDSQR